MHKKNLYNPTHWSQTVAPVPYILTQPLQHFYSKEQQASLKYTDVTPKQQQLQHSSNYTYVGPQQQQQHNAFNYSFSIPQQQQQGVPNSCFVSTQQQAFTGGSTYVVKPENSSNVYQHYQSTTPITGQYIIAQGNSAGAVDNSAYTQHYQGINYTKPNY